MCVILSRIFCRVADSYDRDANVRSCGWRHNFFMSSLPRQLNLSARNRFKKLVNHICTSNVSGTHISQPICVPEHTTHVCIWRSFACVVWYTHFSGDIHFYAGCVNLERWIRLRKLVSSIPAHTSLRSFQFSIIEQRNWFHLGLGMETFYQIDSSGRPKNNFDILPFSKDRTALFCREFPILAYKFDRGKCFFFYRSLSSMCICKTMMKFSINTFLEKLKLNAHKPYSFVPVRLFLFQNLKLLSGDRG